MIPVTIHTQNLGWSNKVIARLTSYMEDLLVSNNKHLGYYTLSNIHYFCTSTNGNCWKEFNWLLMSSHTHTQTNIVPLLLVNSVGPYDSWFSAGVTVIYTQHFPLHDILLLRSILFIPLYLIVLRYYDRWGWHVTLGTVLVDYSSLWWYKLG